MATNLVAKIWQNYLPLHLSLSHSETEWDIATSMCALTVPMTPLYCVKMVNCGPATPEKTGLICVLYLRHGKKLVYLVKYLRIYWTNFDNLYTI